MGKLFQTLDRWPASPRLVAVALQQAGVPWMTFHTIRHTTASLLFDQGRNAKQVQRWLGHHSAAFTLETYIHLLSDELDAPLDLPAGGNTGATSTPLGDVQAATARGLESVA